MGLQLGKIGSGLLDSNPRWLSLTLLESAGTVAATGLIYLLGLITLDITPVTMIIHLLWAITISSWIVSLRIRVPPDKKAVLGLGVA
ncbi:MAG TPA: hypothetical protein VE177_05745, partial [Candidatus Binatus sp.]|nr:hypothetical protein [Candidatus Binatus sp.]